METATLRNPALFSTRGCVYKEFVFKMLYLDVVPKAEVTLDLAKKQWDIFKRSRGAGGAFKGWRTIWHRHQFDTGVNLTPRVWGGQFDTKSVKESIWHRYQFDTKSVKESIWHRHQFDTGPIWHQECKRVNLTPGPIWHRSQFDTI